MAEQEPSPDQTEIDNDDNEIVENYKPPAQVSLDEIKNKDAEDESLDRYKKQLLGQAASANEAIVVFPDNPSRVVLTKLAMITEGRPDQEVDLNVGDEELKKNKIKLKIKEGAEYQIRVSFFVQREIVAGLRYHQVTYRKGIKVDRSNTMIGSYGPDKQQKEYLSKPEEAPKGMVARGSYNVKSSFIDDDKNVFKEWEWGLEIVKDYKD